MSDPIRIAMWSGPRNLSTAMMRSFGSRRDCGVIDEPFYVPYLVKTGIDHPMRDEVIAAGSADPEAAIAKILGPAPGDAPIYYQKHMSQHMLPSFPRDWFKHARHAILIRPPERVVASFSAKMGTVTESDIGFARLAEIDAEIKRLTGRAPPVVEADDIRNDPEGLLKVLCQALDIAYDPAMLRWPSGRHDADGIWCRHWYNAVEASTGFTPAPDALPEVADWLKPIVEQSRPYYEALTARKLRAA